MDKGVCLEAHGSWPEEYSRKKVPARKILECIRAGSSVFVESGCGEPQHLVKSLIFENKNLTDVQVFTSVPLRSYSDYGGEFGSRFRIKSFFISPGMTNAFAQGNADHMPLCTSGMTKLFSEEYIKVNTILIQLSPPDENGYMSLGVMVDIIKAIMYKADTVIAQVNAFMPRTCGDSMIHVDDVDYIVEHDEPLVSYSPEETDPEILMVGANVAGLIEDGSTLQVGFGRIPDAALMNLSGKRDISVHSEIITDTIVDLVHAGVVEGNGKSANNGAITASLCIGTEKIFEFVRSNPMVELKDLSCTGNLSAILSHDRFVAINGAMEIDLTGQSCVGLGEYMGYFGALGHSTFNRTAMFTTGGKGIIALRSTSRDGRYSRIVPEFTDSRIGIITTQSDIHYVVTEYGHVNLFGKSIRERALALITIAHPKFRAWLLEEAKRMNYVYADQQLPPEDSRYPAQYEVTREFCGEDFLIRPIKVTDERAIQNLFYSLSTHDKFQRFLMHVTALHHKQAQDLVNVNYKDSMALVVLAGKVEQEHIAAVAHIAREDSSGTRKICEFAAMVDPAWQNKGIGTYLLKCMMAVGKDLGFDSMRAYIWEDNVQMLSAFEKTGRGMTQELECHVYKVRMDI
ncbi:MAG TPA: GNAT family N-acetyltransferase [Deltaproteobacteria bacterium]|nr:GNAT family N-acetyltransferase [Deltaproteobacteria bacterium]HPR50234.1 GNAT family N-acetyltransferase [Deltaproteobacteria bacterium]